jgi:SAM-dependent methyltransferase
VTELVTAAETLAALAACLADRSGEIDLPDDLAAAVNAVTSSVLPELDDLTTEDAHALGAVARAMLAQAASFATDPSGAPPTWSVTDPALLMSLGQASAAFAPLIRDQLGPQLDGLTDALSNGGEILDVGLGVAALAIAFARTFPASTVVGLDIWAPSLELARANIAKAELTDRIEVRNQDVAALADTDRYALIWFAGPFIPPAILDRALERCAKALQPGGWCVFAAYGGADPRQRALADLRTLRSGGAALTDAEILDRLQAAGLKEGRPLAVDIGMPARLIAARR